ncbi:unnamed protein product [Bemisia tabaci]|uniref:Protein YIPF n=1 Tax=Bemisia tabaci TaxID=7038 RepID=A0A9P0AER3_BEMTA|nr:PREDICTED: protein YIPF6 [Bemisia tabaci]CAH0391169.1 unnamed protein product [Bemisia tabaci]
MTTEVREARLDIYPTNYDGPVQGSMDLPNAQQSQKNGEPEFNTLDEPISTTIMRDLKAVGIKFKHVLQPKEKTTLLKEWDLWGPLLLCTFMALMLQGSQDKANNENDGGPEFAEVFVIVWIGAAIVTINSKLLGGNISFLQSVCILGYCLLPLAIALIACRCLVFLFSPSTFLFFTSLCISMSGFLWATYASLLFLGNSQPDGKKALAVYPIFLFYFVIAWLVLASNVH